MCRNEIEKSCCALAECMGALLYANTFAPDGIRIVTESRDFAQRLPRLFRKGLGVRFDVLPEQETGGKLTFQINDPEKIRRVFGLCGFSAENSFLEMPPRVMSAPDSINKGIASVGVEFRPETMPCTT